MHANMGAVLGPGANAFPVIHTLGTLPYCTEVFGAKVSCRSANEEGQKEPNAGR
jgi:hypothetical protein